MSRKSFVAIILMAFLISSCGGGAAPAAEEPAAEAPAATEAPAEAPPAEEPSVAQPEAPSVSQEAAMAADFQLYKSLASASPAPLNRVELAATIQNLDRAQIQPAPAKPVRSYQVNDMRTFWVRDASTLEYQMVNAKLMLISEHAYFWQDMGSKAINAQNEDVAKEDWLAASESFERSYQRVRSIFGNEENPGLDGDPRVFIVHSNNVGNEGGHFSQLDQLPAAVEPYSNEGQYFFISNARSSGIASEYYKEILAHEYQHMIHVNVDADEEGWLNEGLSMMAQQFAGLRGDNWAGEYLRDPDQSLWYWGGAGADYGQSYLYLDYLYERLGADFISALVADQSNGLASIDRTLSVFNSPRGADELYADSIVAAFFNNSALDDGRFVYKIPSLMQKFPVREFAALPASHQDSVQQYGGVDVLSFAGNGKATLEFNGEQRVKLIPADAHSGANFWWSGRNDSSFATLTRRVDLTNATKATLKYWAWYDIEEDWDYAYLMVSTDNGVHWTLVPATSSRATNPNGQNYGYGFSGMSGNGSEAAWIQETANLNAYAGKRILLRFAMLNNSLSSDFGFAMDDLSIAEINWVDDVEAGSKDWQPGGFIRAHNRIPQVWKVRAAEQNLDGSIRLREVDIQSGQGGVDIDFDNLERLVLFVIGEARYTTIPANYQINLR